MTPPTRERELLIALLAALDDPRRAAELPGSDEVIAVARHHRLSALLSATCGNTLPASLAEAFRRDRLVTTAHGLMLSQVAEECVLALAGAGVRTVVLKGLDYDARLYGSSGVRPTSDVDLLVEGEHRRTAFAVLDDLGFEPRAAAPGFDEPDYHEVAWTRAGVEIDLHLALAPLVRCRIDYPAIWSAVEPFRLGHADAWALAPEHAVVFHTLHMAIDHFGVPAIYLVDLARLLDRCDDTDRLATLTRRWRCHGPFDTALRLTAAFLPGIRHRPPGRPSRRAERVIAGYGGTAPLPRGEQLLRKLTHFDGPADAVRYVLTQSRRNVREQLERRLHQRSARARLRLEKIGPAK